MSTTSEEAWEIMDEAVGETWTPRRVLEELQSSYEKEITPREAHEEASMWEQEYGMEPLEARRFAEAYLSYEPDLERDEFKELVDGWTYSN
jgi:hypothetical protein